MSIMKSFLYFIFSLLIMFGCKKEQGKIIELPTKKENSKIIKEPFFVFDKVEHYKLADSTGIDEFHKYRNNSALDSFRLGVVRNEIPNSLSDSSFIEKLQKIGYSDITVPEEKFQILNEIFSEKKVKNTVDYACVPVYRDILIFKKENKISGIAKICFECLQHRIYGTKKSTEEFGGDGDYQRLDSLLNGKMSQNQVWGF